MQLALDLKRILSESTCVVGVGNPLRNDDAIGAMIADRLGGDGPGLEGVTVMNVEDVIENHVFRIAASSASNVLLIDAVCGDGVAEAGSLVLGRVEDMEVGRGGFSTHKLTLSTAARILEPHGKTVYLLGIVAANTDYGTDVSREVLASAEIVIDLVRAITAGEVQ
jgi:hydrogenase 3 maturation protease